MNLSLLHREFYTVFLFFDGADSELSAIVFGNVFIFLMVPTLLGNNSKIGL